MIKSYRSDQTLSDFDEDERHQFVYRHIAYLYQLHEQLLKPAPWEHMSLRWLYGKYNRLRRDKLFGRYQHELDELSNHQYLSQQELISLKDFNNKATQLLDRQSQIVQSLYSKGMINRMQQIDLQNIINNFYDDQGRAERIKNFPFPHQFASFSYMFTCIFVFLLPFGIMGEFNKLGDDFDWLTIPIGMIIGWIYMMMEMIDDYSENPFEGLYNDIPMLTIYRTIEIDLLQMLDETEVPQPIQPKEGSLL